MWERKGKDTGTMGTFCLTLSLIFYSYSFFSFFSKTKAFGYGNLYAYSSNLSLLLVELIVFFARSLRSRAFYLYNEHVIFL